MGFFIRYLRKHFPKNVTTEFDVLEAFKASKYTNRATAETEFKLDIKEIASWSPSALQKWAVQQSQSFSVCYLQQKRSAQNF